MYNNINTKKGLTLIELLVVISIIGLLSSVVLTLISEARQSSRDAKLFTEVQQVRNAIYLYRLENNNYYPEQLSELVTGGYLGDVPQLSSGNISFIYIYQDEDYEVEIICGGKNFDDSLTKEDIVFFQIITDYEDKNKIKINSQLEGFISCSDLGLGGSCSRGLIYSDNLNEFPGRKYYCSKI